MSNSTGTTKTFLARMIGAIAQIIAWLAHLPYSRLLLPLGRFCAWAIFFGAVMLYGFLTYTAFGGGSDIGAIAGGLLGAGILTYFVKNSKSIRREWPLAFKGLIYLAIIASGFLTAAGAMRITQPSRDWLTPANIAVFGIHLVAVYVIVFVGLPLFLHITRKMSHVTHVHLHNSFGLSTTLLGVLATIGMACFAWYFIFTGEGGNLPATVNDGLPILFASLSLLGICIYAKNWSRIFRGGLSIDAVAVRIFTLSALIAALWVMDRGVWNSLYSESILSPHLPISAKLTYASIVLMFDSIILFGAPLVNGVREGLVTSFEDSNRRGILGIVVHLFHNMIGTAPQNSSIEQDSSPTTSDDSE